MNAVYEVHELCSIGLLTAAVSSKQSQPDICKLPVCTDGYSDRMPPPLSLARSLIGHVELTHDRHSTSIGMFLYPTIHRLTCITPQVVLILPCFRSVNEINLRLISWSSCMFNHMCIGLFLLFNIPLN